MGRPEGTGQLDAVAGRDLVAERRRDTAAGNAPDVEMDGAGAARIIEGGGRAERPRRKTVERDVQILPRQDRDGLRRDDEHLGEIGREIADLGHMRGRRQTLRQGVGRDRHVRNDAALAGMHFVRRAFAAAGEKLALDGAHATFAALAGSAIVRDIDTVAEGCVEEEFLVRRPELFAVEAHPMASVHRCPLYHAR